jgi:nuclease S1
MKSSVLCGLTLLMLAGSAGAPAAQAWGCKGHQTVALIAEKQLTPEAKQIVLALLAGNPIDPALKRYCGDTIRDAMADASTWPDDIRGAAKNGPWHYIDIPRGAKRAPLSEFCGKEGCVTRAIENELSILENKNVDAARRAEALRYLIHFVGDLHQPLHATTNNDEGGNCVPVNYFRRKARQHDQGYSPNLHSLWDTAIPERDMEGADPAEYAETLDEIFAGQIESWKNAGIHIEDWAWESHEYGQRTVYGELKPKIAIESPVEVKSCADDNNIGDRLLRQHIAAGAAYQEKAGSIVEERIAQAGVRLAMILNEAAKRAP